MPSFRIKICGITSPEDALAAIAAGADAIGLNFFPGSLRYVDPDKAAGILAAINSTGDNHPAIVGVFVDSPPRELVEFAHRLGLRWVQLHGHEDDEYIDQICDLLGPEVGIIRAFRPKVWDDLPQVAGFVARRAHGVCPGRDSANGRSILDSQGGVPTGANIRPWAVLIDAASSRGLGGTGELADWALAATCKKDICTPHKLKMILAGGLHPGNVGQAIRRVRPDAVDTASGVESVPGKKDPAKLREFVAAAHAAFDELALFDRRGNSSA